MSKMNEGKKWKKGGRKPEKNPKIYRYSVNFDEVENMKSLHFFSKPNQEMKAVLLL